MPLETATYISDFVTSNPAASDGMNNADDHMRLIKSAVKNTFPNITGAVTASHTELNSMRSQFLGSVAYIAPLGTVGAPGYAFIGDLDTGWYSPGANRAALALGGADALNFATDKTATFGAGAAFAGPITATKYTGPGAVPIGGMMMWLTDTLPSGFGVWCWANGGTLSRTTVGAGKELYDLVGTTYGIGDGSTTFNVFNAQEVVLVGKSGMGGAASPGLLSSISAGLKGVLGGLFGSDTVTLVTGNLPAHDHAVYLRDPGHSHSYTMSTLGPGTGSSPNYFYSSITGATTGAATTGITIGSVNGTANDNKTAQTGSATAVANVQPSRAVNYIIRIA